MPQPEVELGVCHVLINIQYVKIEDLHVTSLRKAKIADNYQFFITRMALDISAFPYRKIFEKQSVMRGLALG